MKKRDYVLKEMELQFVRIGEILDKIKESDDYAEYKDDLMEADYLTNKLNENFDDLLLKHKYSNFKKKVGGIRGMKWGRRS